MILGWTLDLAMELGFVYIAMGVAAAWTFIAYCRALAFEKIDNRVLNAAKPELARNDPKGRHAYDAFVERKIRHKRQQRALYNYSATPRWLDTAISKKNEKNGRFSNTKKRASIFW